MKSPLYFPVLAVLIAGSAFVAGRSTQPAAPSTAPSSAPVSASTASPDSLRVDATSAKKLGIRTSPVRSKFADEMLEVNGDVEADAERSRTLTPLVGGRIEHINYRLGDAVAAGAVVATLRSPDVAEMQGKYNEATVRLDRAKRELVRVRSAENRVAIATAKAKLTEAEASYSRVEQLEKIGAAAEKDVIAARTGLETARAEYAFRRSVSLNREVQQAEGEVALATTEAKHIRGSLAVLGAVPDESRQEQETAGRVALLSPIEGILIKRDAGDGVGVESGKALFTIADTSRFWIVAAVPPDRLAQIRMGESARVTDTRTGKTYIGNVSYIDPGLDEKTRTGRVRVDLTSTEPLKLGSFVTVSLTIKKSSRSVMRVPADAVTQVGDRTLVFVRIGNTDEYRARTVETAGEHDGVVDIKSGLSQGDQVATSGVFSLKSLLLKSSFGGDD